MINKKIADSLGIRERQVEQTAQLFFEGATIPFVARYRKERTGNLDEVQLLEIQQKLEYFDTLQKRKTTILASIAEQEKLTPELERAINETYDATALEDLYAPYKPKRKTRATVAREKGLEPLALLIYSQKNDNIQQEITATVKRLNLPTEECVQGAQDIIAELISERIDVKNALRKEFAQNAQIATKVIKTKKDEATNYEQYFEFSELIRKSPSHRILAMMRGHNEGFLRLSIAIDEAIAVKIINRLVLKGYNDCANFVKIAIEDAYKRLLSAQLETEFYNELKQRADTEAIRVFAENLRQLLLLPPLGQKRILALDPGFRTGCKVVCLSEQGDLLHNETIYPHAPQNETAKARAKILQLVQSYKIQAIAIGNGTASRETENFIKYTKFTTDVQVFVVSEAGASVYSASKVAREEFPSYDVTVRGAISIGRRLIDPLAELVKIEPKAIGVGQYQHDVNQTELQRSLDFTVESCVNKVGVELNTASKHLLAYVAGIGSSLAENIVNYRKENGAFSSRADLLKIPKLGKKTFEQCAGFLRIRGAKNPLDNSAIHPERYALVQTMARDLKVTIADLLSNAELRKSIPIEKYETDEIGAETLHDILQELEKPGRDPRAELQQFSFAEGLKTLDDVQVGAVYPGIVNNITNFGAFVDIGIKQSGLVHISQICKEFISNPADVLSLNQHVQVKVLEVDKEKKRLQLTMK
ncbi:MAG: RNA-binding transcriptional accessory protein [Bacteroidetes bacterium]|nr:RNA-binding transcriptional accessory protein [Bacteroidota bacterium]